MEKISTFIDKIRRFYCSDLFTLCLSVLIILFWALGCETIGTAVLITVMCFYLFIGSDLKPVISVVMLFVMQISLNEAKTTAFLAVACVFGSLAAISLIYNMVRFRKERTYRKGKLFYGMLALYVASVFSGLFYGGYNKIWMLVIIALGPLIYLVYFLCLNCVKGDLAVTICKALFAAGMIAALETVIYFIRKPDFVAAVVEDSLRLGWGMSNTIPVYFVMAVPAVIYLGIRFKPYAYVMFPASMFLFIMLFFTLSRGNLLFGTPIIITAMIFGLVKCKSKGARITFGVTIAACLGLLFVVPGIAPALEVLKGQGTGVSGRDILYTDAIKRFLEQPIFGVGYFKPAGLVYPLDGPSCSFMWKNHDTFLQILSCNGIVGVIALVPYIYLRYATLIRSFSDYKFMALCSVLAYELEGLLDVTFLSIHQLFFVLALIAASERETDEILSRKSLEQARELELELNGAGTQAVEVEAAEGTLSCNETEQVVERELELNGAGTQAG